MSIFWFQLSKHKCIGTKKDDDAMVPIEENEVGCWAVLVDN